MNVQISSITPSFKYLFATLLTIGLIVIPITSDRTVLQALLFIQILVLWQVKRINPEFGEISFFLLAWACSKYFFPTYQIWPLTFLIPMVATFAFALLTRAPLLNKLTLGRPDRASVKLAILIGLVSIVALYVWLQWFHPDLQIQQGLIPQGSIFLLGVLLVGFALVNATMEEIIYRGWWFPIPAGRLEQWVMVSCQAIGFGAAHVIGGVPGGTAGFTMTFCYALMLGWLRLRSGGLLLPLCVHIVTDIYIGTILFSRN